MSDTVNLTLLYGDTKAKLYNIAPNIPLADLKKEASKCLEIDAGTIKILRHDEDDDDWFVLGGNYTLQKKEKLKVILNTATSTSHADPPPANTTAVPTTTAVTSPSTTTTKTATPMDTSNNPGRQAALLATWKESIEYKLQSKPDAQGIAFICGTVDAQGVDNDLDNMKRAFDNLSFLVMSATNRTADDLKACIQAAAYIRFPKNYQYIAFYYAGHGGSDTNGNSLIKPLQVPGVSQENVYIVSDILQPLESSQKKKRLLFFFDCCLTVTDKVTAKEFVQKPAGHPACLVAYATTFGDASFGSKTYGGVWTRSLSKHLDDDNTIVNILSIVNEEVKKNPGKQNCRFDSNLPVVNLKSTVDTKKVDIMKMAPEHGDVYKLMKKNLTDYDEIGRVLNVDYSQRSQLAIIHPLSFELRMQGILNIWIQYQTTEVTWGNLINKIRNDAGLKKLAREIEEYLKDSEVKERYTQ